MYVITKHLWFVLNCDILIMYKHPYANIMAFNPQSWFLFFLDFCLPSFIWVSFLALYNLFIFMIYQLNNNPSLFERYFYLITNTSLISCILNLDQLCLELVINLIFWLLLSSFSSNGEDDLSKSCLLIGLLFFFLTIFDFYISWNFHLPYGLIARKIRFWEFFN